MKFPGGKGINVSRVLQRLGVKNIALGFTGGFTGQFIKEVLQTEGVTTNFVQVDEDTRINVKIKGRRNRIKWPRSYYNKRAVRTVNEKIESMQPGDCVVLAGSVPVSIPSTFYESIAAFGAEKVFV